MQHVFNKRIISEQGGAVAVIVAVCLVLFVGFTALAVDVGHLYVVRNELQNSADAGALAGARCLLCQEDQYCVPCPIGEINPMANTLAQNAAADNKSEQVAVEVLSIERGHWSFATRTFTPNPSLTQTELWDRGMSELDADPAFINAVRVITQRNDTPATLYLAKIFGMESTSMTAQAVAWVGFEGTIEPFDLDQPVALCKEAITNEAGEYSCNNGRMINSGPNSNTSNTGAWTNFSQPCVVANNKTVDPLVCGDGNPSALTVGEGIGTTNGEIQSIFGNPSGKESFYSCWWRQSNGGRRPWKVRLPVVSCPDPSISICATLLGAVDVNIMWMQIQANDCYRSDSRNPTENYPTVMEGIEGTDYGSWASPNPADPAASWASFFSHFNLQNVSGPATCAQKTIYFLPDCTPHEPAGNTGGENFGIQAKIPVLVN